MVPQHRGGDPFAPVGDAFPAARGAGALPPHSGPLPHPAGDDARPAPAAPHPHQPRPDPAALSRRGRARRHLRDARACLALRRTTPPAAHPLRRPVAMRPAARLRRSARQRAPRADGQRRHPRPAAPADARARVGAGSDPRRDSPVRAVFRPDAEGFLAAGVRLRSRPQCHPRARGHRVDPGGRTRPDHGAAGERGISLQPRDNGRGSPHLRTRPGQQQRGLERRRGFPRRRTLPRLLPRHRAGGADGVFG